MSDVAEVRVTLATIADLRDVGGVPRVARRLRDELPARGCPVHVISRPLSAWIRQGLVRRVWRRLAPSAEEAHRIERSIGAIERDLRGDAPTGVCLALDAWSAAACVAAGQATVFRMAGLGSITDEWVRNGFLARSARCVPRLRRRELAGALGASRVIAQAEEGRRALAHLGVPNERIVVIPNGVEIPAAVRPRESDTVRIACVANLRHVKGVDVLARAIGLLVADVATHVELVHVGGGNDRGNATYEEATRVLGAGTVRHTFEGAVPHDRVAQLLADSDVFVLPSRVEMFPNALLEAMAAGLPVVATRVGAVADILGAEGMSSIVPPQDPTALARALERLVRNPALRRALGAANRARAEAEFGVARMIERYAAVLRDVAAQR